MKIAEVAKLLGEKGLKKTKVRLALAQHFINRDQAQSYSDLQAALRHRIDKSTLYRNLASFEKVGLIHRIDDLSGSAKYAFGTSPEQGSRHAHFVCECCEAVYCLKEFEEPVFDLPRGFQPREKQIIIKGVCANC